VSSLAAIAEHKKREMTMPNRALRKTMPVLSAILLFLLCINAFAQQTKGTELKHPLWKISSKTNTVYLLGSVHVLKQDAYPLDKSIENAYKNSPRLIFEMNLDEVDPLKVQQLTIAKGTYHDGRTIKDDLSKQAYESTKKRLTAQGLDIEKIEQLKPWLLAVSIEVIELQRLGFDPNWGIDKYFYEKAKKDKKKIDGFETAEYQMNILCDMPASMQEAMLLQIINDIDDVQKEFNVIIEAWKSGNAEMLDSVLLKSFRDFPEVYQKLITDRNKNWLPKIESLTSQKENAMIIVGAGHLVGERGILAALKHKGYEVEQL
jgi:uncharacterized protein YbaP (TraB family)